MIKNKRIFSKVLMVFAIFVMAVVMLAGCGKKKEENKAAEAFKEPISNYFDGIKNRDVNVIYKAFPSFMEMEKNITADDVNELYRQYESLYGANIRINYEIGEATKVEEEEVKQIQEDLINVYKEKADKIEVTEGYIVPVKVTITGDGLAPAEGEEQKEASNVQESDLQVFCINGTWCMV